MNFFYRPALTYSPESGEPTLILRPEISIRVIGPTGAAEFRALVDTGADNTILPRTIAEVCGVTLTEGLGPKVVAFGGQQISTLYRNVEFELHEEGDTIRWPARVQFFDFESGQSESVILGHAGFLDYFTATFDGHAAVLSLSPNGDLPQ